MVLQFVVFAVPPAYESMLGPFLEGTPNSLEKALRQYIPEELPRLQETTGGAAVLRWDADHWALVSSLVPFIVGAELDAPQRVLSSSVAAT